MAAPILQFKRGAFTNLPGLRAGEPGFTTDKYDLYVGLTSSTTTNKFFGSARYWTRETASTAAGLNFVENTTGTDYITLKAPDSISGIGTYTLPDTNSIVDGYFLKVSTGGQLSWQSITGNVSLSNALLSGITTISGSLNNTASTTNSGITTFTNTTDNTLGNSNTGAIQIDGGVGIDKNLTVGANLHVQGYSNFVGVVTFQGGTINLGDSNTDNINVTGEFISNLTPNTTNTYDVGISTQQWRDAYFAGIGSFANLRVVSNLFDSSNSQGTSGQFLTVTGSGIGWATISGVSAGTISTAARANAVDTTTAPSGTFYPGLFVNATGTASTAVYVDAGISYVSNTDTLTLTGDLAVNGGDVTTSATTFNLINGTATNVNFAGAATALVMGAATGITTVSNNLTVAGDVRINGNDIQSSTGANVITLATNNATFANDVTVTGNLYVNGSTTQVNTTALTVEDRTIDLGIVNGAVPSTNTTWDLGILFNYYSAAVAKKSAVIWEHTDTRFKFASVLAADTDGSTVDTPQLTVTTFAPIEVAELWINNTCTGGSQQVIGCIGAELNLQNIVVDAGQF
jgi:hypothetical protein